MGTNVDNLSDSAFIRSENGRAVEGRKSFQRNYASFDDILADNTIPAVGDRFSTAYPDLVAIAAEATPRSQNADGTTIYRIVVDYIDQGAVHLEGGSATATVLTSFDRLGNRIIVSYQGESYIAQVEYEEPRGYMMIEQFQTFEGTGSIAQHVQSVLNKLNADPVQGLPARCWRISKIDYQLVRDWFNGVQKKSYRCQYYVESLRPRSVQLVPLEPVTVVPGWDKVVGFEQEGGVIPTDAIFQVVQLYDEIDYLGAAGVFGGVPL